MAFGYAVYFADRAKHRVVRWDPDSGDIDIVAGGVAGELNSPYGLAFDKDGKLLIADKGNHRIIRLESGRREPFPIRESSGKRARLPETPKGYILDFLSPAGLFARRNKAILCAFYDDYSIYDIHPDGRADLVLGVLRNRAYNLTRAREVIPEAELPTTPLHMPVCVVEQSDGTLFLIERGSQVVREYTPGRGMRSLFPLSKQSEWASKVEAPSELSLGDYHPAYPGSLALDLQERLHIAEIGHGCVIRIDLESQYVRRVMESRGASKAERGGIDALTFGPDGTAWVVDAAAGCVEAYSTANANQWTPAGPRLTEVRGEPLKFLIGGCGIVAGK